MFIRLNPGTAVMATGQPNDITLHPTNVTAENYIAKKLLQAWPQSSWGAAAAGNQAMVAMGERLGFGWNTAFFTTNYPQNYNIVVRFFYWA